MRRPAGRGEARPSASTARSADSPIAADPASSGKGSSAPASSGSEAVATPTTSVQETTTGAPASGRARG